MYEISKLLINYRGRYSDSVRFAVATAALLLRLSLSVAISCV